VREETVKNWLKSSFRLFYVFGDNVTKWQSFYAVQNKMNYRGFGMSLESGKNLAGIGSILLVIPVPFLSIVGIILVLVGMKNLSKAYNDESIWKNTLYAVIFGIIGIVASGLTLVSLFFGGIFAGAALGVGDATGLAGFFAGLIIFLVVAFIFYILEAIYIRRAFDSLANRSGVGLFRTGGLLLLIGAVLTIILVGLFLIFIAWILILVAFFQIPINSTSPQSQSPTPPPVMT
jgi:uncharacterized membrane protein